MRISEFIDFIQRKINSFLFRFLLIAYSLTLLLTHENLFHGYIYTITFSLYLIFYIVLLKYQKIRLINDFLFIVMCVIGKNPNEAFVFVYILLPVINSINFSGIKKSPILYFITAITYLILLCYYSNRFELTIVFQSLLPLSTLIFLWFIEKYTTLRLKIRDFRDRLNEVVDSFYTEKELLKKPHKIYSELINLINSRIKKDLIVDLFCFTVLPESQNKIVIVNGSKFIWQYKLNESDLLKKFEEKKYLLNIDITLEGLKIPFNLALLVEIENTKYIFIFSTKRMIPLYYILIGFFRTLIPSLSKMAKILLSERRLQEIQTEELYKLSIRSQYVTRATKTMHYIRNRLGPMTNLIKMLDNLNSIEKDKKTEFEKLLLSEKDRVKFELQSIVNRANYLLEKSNNPFNFAKTEKVTLKKFFSILRRHVNIFFPNIEITISKLDDISDSCIEINDEGFELFLSDWLNNIKKYYNGTVEISFNIYNDKISVDFLNDYVADISVINQLITDLMSDERNEIMKRTTHGLYQIKTSLDEMNIKYNIEKVKRETNFIKFTIELKLIKDENCNI